MATDELAITTLAMGAAMHDFLMSHLPDCPQRDYVLMRVAKIHVPKPAAVEEIAPARPPVVRTQTSLPSMSKRVPAGTPDDCMAEAHNIIIETVEAKGEMPLPALAVLTGLKGEALTEFVEAVLADYVKVKHIDPRIGESKPAPTKQKRKYTRSPEAKAKAAAGLQAYHERRRAEKNKGWVPPGIVIGELKGVG
jgi:hypothetical protein